MYSGVARSSYRQHCWSGRGHLSHEVRTKDFFKFPLNAPTQKIIGWEIFVQSQSKHFIPVQKQVSKRRSNMHKIKKIR